MPTPSYLHRRSPPASYCHRTCPPSCYIPHTLATHPLLFGALIMITQCPALPHQPRSTSLGMWDGKSHALPPQWVQKLGMKRSLVFWLPPDNSTSELIRLAEILGSTFGTKKWGLNHSKTALYRCYLISHHKNSDVELIIHTEVTKIEEKLNMPKVTQWAKCGELWSDWLRSPF